MCAHTDHRCHHEQRRPPRANCVYLRVSLWSHASRHAGASWSSHQRLECLLFVGAGKDARLLRQASPRQRPHASLHIVLKDVHPSDRRLPVHLEAYRRALLMTQKTRRQQTHEEKLHTLLLYTRVRMVCEFRSVAMCRPRSQASSGRAAAAGTDNSGERPSLG